VLRGTKRAHAGGYAEPFFLIGPVVTVGEAQDFRMFGTLVKLAKARGAELDREGEKKRRELEGKAAGGTREHLYLGQHQAGRLDASDAIPDAAGGEGGHGAARPDGVIHRKHF
jgi:hypothetical protein